MHHTVSHRTSISQQMKTLQTTVRLETLAQFQVIQSNGPYLRVVIAAERIQLEIKVGACFRHSGGKERDGLPWKSRRVSSPFIPFQAGSLFPRTAVNLTKTDLANSTNRILGLIIVVHPSFPSRFSYSWYIVEWNYTGNVNIELTAPWFAETFFRWSRLATIIITFSILTILCFISRWRRVDGKYRRERAR